MYHVQIPYGITAASSSPYRDTITRGKPVPLPKPWEMPPYTPDTNCEWVLDAGSRKICWISPRNLQRGGGGHFWAGPELVVVGDDGIVSKVSFKEPEVYVNV
jgi:hypothetical protein